MKLYLLGPMTGMVDQNHPAFHEAAAKLRAMGHEVLSPAEHDIPEAQLSEDGWVKALEYDVGECVCKVQGYAVLEGFQHSRGAMLEGINCIALKRTLIVVPGQEPAFIAHVRGYLRHSLEHLYRSVPGFVYDQQYAKFAGGA